MEKFSDLGLSEQALAVIKKKGFEAPTEIQLKAIPFILGGERDFIGQAQTGTGKTAAFALPIIEQIEQTAEAVQVLVLTPTRELAVQVAEEINSLKGKKKLSVMPIYGGQSINLQLRRLRKKVDIVVGTPGRIIDHLNRGTLELNKISYLVLDEADEMLNMGFIEDVTKIIKSTNDNKRTFLFSATMPAEITKIAKKYMSGYQVVRVSGSELTVSQTDQIYFEVTSANKFEALCRIIDIEDNFYGLVFCKTKVDVDRVAKHLYERGYDADALHGDMSQALREKVLAKFKKRIITILVATDVAARGIDIQELTHVINYALPGDPHAYVHRIGRTGRAGRQGNAITFVTPSEYRRLHFIRKKAGLKIRREKIPGISDVIEAKRIRIKNTLSKLGTEALQPEYLKMSQELLEDNNPQQLVASVLQHCFGEELSEEKYNQMKNNTVDIQGKTRLFITQGRDQGLTPRSLMKTIQAKSDVKRSQIKDIQILDRFSFATLPFSEAEKVLSFFRKKRDKSGLTIKKAKKPRRRK
jgi:ATP-dependent RNA helicase DeaD